MQNIRIISLVGARPRSVSLSICCMSSCSCCGLRRCWLIALACIGAWVPLHLRASVCLLTWYFSATFVYESFSPSSCASIASTARSIGSILVELSRVKVGVTLVFWCLAERYAGPSATPIYMLLHHSGRKNPSVTRYDKSSSELRSTNDKMFLPAQHSDKYIPLILYVRSLA
jgi:hypothetical protein